MNDLNVLDENGIFYCDYCSAKFSTNSNRLKHMKTSKKCLSIRQNKECIWCNETFVSSIKLEKHSKVCTVNKENAYMSLKKEYEKRIEELIGQLKDANDKIFKLADKPTTILASII